MVRESLSGSCPPWQPPTRRVCLDGGLSQATAARQQDEIDGLNLLPGPGSFARVSSKQALRLPAPIHPLYHPLYVLVSKILSSILNSPAPIHPLYHPLSTLFTVGPTYHFI
jgi:hypothetical protein